MTFEAVLARINSYLKKYKEEMNKDEYARELVLLNNSIYGMAGITH